MMRIPQEELTASFYAWEKRGRGWQRWPYRVRLEPPFRPFPGHYLEPREALDDGRRSVWRSLRGLFRERRPEIPPAEVEEPEPQPAREAGRYVELPLILPANAHVDRGTTEQFLATLVAASHPVSFEILGTRERITMQLAASATDEVLVREVVRNFFPAASIADVATPLPVLWAEQSGAAVVVEIALAREFMLPIHVPVRLDPDPLLGVIAGLGGIEEDEIAIVQVLFEATAAPWRESVLRAVLDWEGKPFFEDAPDLTKLAAAKVASPLFAATLRVGAVADNPERVEEIVVQLCSALTHFDAPEANAFRILDSTEYDELEADLLDRASHRSGMLLSVAELAGLVHPPSASVQAPKLLRVLKTTKAAPAALVGHDFVLGINDHAGRETIVSLPRALRMRHLDIVGVSGTGKSTLLLDLLMQTVESGEGLCLIDPHGDLVDEVLGRIPEARIDDVILCDPSDFEYVVGFNLLDAKSETEATLLASDLVAIFRRLSTSWGDQMHSVLANAIQGFLTSTTGGSLADLRRFLIEPDFRAEFLKSVEDEEVVYYWTKEFPLLVGKPQGPILTRLDSFLRPRPLRAMFTAKESGIDFREVMDKGRIFLAKLAQGAIGQENAALLGSLLVAKFHQAALSRQDTALESRREFRLVADELQDVVTPSLASILAGTRKFGMGFVGAHQDYRTMFEADPVTTAALANAATRIVFRVGDEDARRLADGFSAFDAAAILNLGVGEAICRVDRAEWDFNLRTRMLPKLDPTIAAERRQQVIERSRAQHAVKVVKPERKREPQAEAEETATGKGLEALLDQLEAPPKDGGR